MTKPLIKMLLIEDNTADALLLKESLGSDLLTDFQVTVAEQLKTGLEKLREEKFDVLLLDLGLPDSQGLKTFETAYAEFPEMPMIVLSGMADDLIALQAVHSGAQDYLVKGEAGWSLGPRAIRYAVERSQAQAAMRASEARFSTVFHFSPMPTTITRLSDNHILEVNEAWAQITGYSSAEVIGRNLEELDLWVQPEERRKLISLVRRDGTVHGFEFQMRRRSGQLASVLLSAEVIELAGEACLLATAQDITERKLAEEALQASELRFRALIEHGMDNISLLAADGTLLWENPAAVHLLGYAYDQFKGNNIFELLHPDDMERVQTQFAEILGEPGNTAHSSFRLKHANDTWRWVEGIGTNLLHEPSVGAIVINYRDITERKLAEEQLTLSQITYLGIINSITEAIYIQDENGIFLDVNQTSEKIYGYSRDEFIGQTPAFLSAPGRNNLAEVVKFLGKAYEGEPQEFEFWGLRKDGSIFPKDVSLTPGIYFGRKVIIAVARDITERKLAEEKLREQEKQYRSLVEQLPAIVFIDDAAAEGRTLYISPQIEAILGFTQQAWQENSPGLWSQQVHPDDLERVHAEYMRCFEYGEPYKTEYRIRASDGRLLWFRDHAVMLRDESGQPHLMHGLIYDITERKLAEETLLISQRRYRALFEDSPIAIWEEDFSEVKKYIDFLKQQGITDFPAYFTNHPDTVAEYIRMIKILDVNSAALHMYRAPSKEKLIENTLQTLCMGEMEHNCEDFIAIAEGRTGNHWDGGDETMLGQTIEISLTWSVVPGYENDFSKVIVTTVDITERKQAEKALQEAESKYRMLVERLPAVVYTSEEGINGNWPYVSPQIEQLLGFTPQEWLADPTLWFQHIHPEDRDALKLLEEQASAKGEPFSNEYRMFSRAGREIWVRDSAQILPALRGGTRIAQGVLMDITERKLAEEALHESESRYKNMFENNYAVMLIIDPDNADIVDANPAACTFYGWSHEELLKKKIEEINTLTPEETQAEMQLARTEKRNHFLFKHRRSDDSIRDVEVYSGPLVLAGKSLLYSIVHDITKRRQAEALIQQYTDDLELRVAERTAELVHANRTKDEFLANMSHELRTPLNGILGFSETLLEEIRGPLNEKQQQSVKIIRSSGQHLLGLINDILDVSKIESGMFQLETEMLVVDAVCHSSLNLIKQLARRKSITVEYESHPDTAMLVADPRRLKQILVNLLSNAVKFTPENGMIKLEVLADASAGLMRFSVTDTGIGISAEDQQKLFKPFVQVDSSLSRQYEGTGLGLMLVKNLVEMHNGSIELQSQPGQGSCFTFILPWSSETQEHEIQPLLPAEADERAPMRAAGTTIRGKILIAEDNENNVIAIKDYLEHFGYEVVVAIDGREACSKAEQLLPDLILMDIQMPKLNGLEATRLLRADPRFATVPIIALTAFAMDEDRERCLEAGMNEYLSKPVPLKDMYQMIESFLGQPKSG